MNLLDAFKQGGVTGLAFTLGANAKGGEVLSSVSPETRRAVFNEAADVKSRAGLFNLSFGDKALLALMGSFALAIVVGKILK